ncbi:Von Willebrand domain-containing protein [Oopsacas minuta]|uniref:von Willebrand domain-containing protein n=1 Tax=Oopsacas minuta TaxID=111878 RepID=A0AAV7JGM1_9METZ|nr:Von Willebrand domain-containing protein [Oopsacas minuta]
MSMLQTDKGFEVPLTSISADIHITDYSASVTLTQTYNNSSTEPIEANYHFPITDSSAITGFTAKINDKIIRAEVKENEEAKEIYDDSISSGHGAYLLQQTSDDMFTMSVGNLPPKTEVTIEISYICELAGSGKEQSPHVLFNIPTTIMKPYTPPNSSVSTPGPDFQHSKVTYTFNARVKAQMHCKIDKVHCNTHDCNVNYTSPHEVEVSVKKRSQNVVNKGYSLEIYLKEPHKPRIWSEKRPDNSVALMLVAYPNIQYKELTTEIIFVVDRSGSMGGKSILEARAALKTCLELLPPSVLFNIIGFGSDFISLFKSSQRADKSWLKRAIDHAKKIGANLGGTDILPPFKHIYAQKLIPGTPRNIFVLTDGGVGNTEEVKTTVHQNSNSTRVFSFGIGQGVSEALVKGIARLGKGKAVFIRDVTDMKGIISSQLQAALQPAMTDTQIKFTGVDINQIAPSTLPPIFNLEQYIVYAFSEPNFTGNLDNIQVTLSAIDPNKKEVEYKVKLSAATNMYTKSSDQIIQKLAARALIQEMEEMSLTAKPDLVLNLKKKVIELGLAYSLATKYNSFVAVEERDTSSVQQAPMKKVDVPLPIPSGSQMKCKAKQVGGFSHKVDSSLFKFTSIRSNYPGILTRYQSAKLLQEFKSASPKRGSSNEIDLPSKFHKNCSYNLRDFPFRNMLETSIGMPLAKSPPSLSDPCIQFALRGAVIDSNNYTCWLDVSIAFMISIRPLKECLLTFKSDVNASILLTQLSIVIDVWVNQDNSSLKWRKILKEEYQKLMDILKAIGYSFTRECSPCDFIQLVREEISKVGDYPCLCYSSMEDFTRNLSSANYVIIKNTDQFPKVLPQGWKLSSLINMSSVDCRGDSMFCGHFSLFSFDNSPPGFVIYDSMLTLSPGNYQGGFVSKENSVYSTVIDEVMDNVVLYCLMQK